MSDEWSQSALQMVIETLNLLREEPLLTACDRCLYLDPPGCTVSFRLHNFCNLLCFFEWLSNQGNAVELLRSVMCPYRTVKRARYSVSRHPRPSTHTRPPSYRADFEQFSEPHNGCKFV